MIKKTRKTANTDLYGDNENSIVPAFNKEQDKAIDSMEVLRHIIEVCDIQISRFMNLIGNAQQAPGGLVVTGISEKEEETKGTQRGAESDFKENQTVTNTVASYELILKYNNEIEKAKHEKLRCIELLIKMTPQVIEYGDDGFITALSSVIEETWKEGDTLNEDEMQENEGGA